jgi:pimeloyl-ACP methyl ester carboxylesterase
MVVCNAPHPWSRLSLRLVLELWRSWYTWLIAMPGLGRRVLTSGWIARQYMRLNADLPFSQDEAEMYMQSFREPARAQAVVELYRYYQRVAWQTARGSRAHDRLERPTLLLFGERDASLSTLLLPGYESHAADMRVDLVPDSGHFIVDEKPDLVIERTREWLSMGS